MYIEKCSESIGTKFVLFLFKFFLINSHPHINDSLLAIAKFFEYSNMGNNNHHYSNDLLSEQVKRYKKNPNNSKIAFSRQKTLSTLRFNFYPNQTKPVEISKQDGVHLGCETHVDSGIFTRFIPR